MAIVSLFDAKNHLNITSASSDDELTAIMDAASDIVESQIGSVTPTQYTETHNGGTAVLVTYHAPVISVQSVTEYIGNTAFALTSQPVGFSTDPWGYTLDDPASGRITRRTMGSYPTAFMGGVGAVLITYTAGRTVVPPSVRLACLVIIASLWETQRGAVSLPLPGGSGMIPASPTRAGMPELARMLLEGSGLSTVPGIG